MFHYYLVVVVDKSTQIYRLAFLTMNTVDYLLYYFEHFQNAYTVISWIRGEQWNYCPEIAEKIWETVARGQWPRATVSQNFSTTEGQLFDCFPRSLEITVLLPNCFKSPKYCQQCTNARRRLRNVLRFVTSFVTWPVNSALLTGQQFVLLPAHPEVAKLSCKSQKYVILI